MYGRCFRAAGLLSDHNALYPRERNREDKIDEFDVSGNAALGATRRCMPCRTTGDFLRHCYTEK